MLCPTLNRPLSDYRRSVDIRRRWYLTTRNHTSQLSRRRISIDSVQHEDAGRYVCVIFRRRTRDDLYNVTYVLNVYGQQCRLLHQAQSIVYDVSWKFVLSVSYYVIICKRYGRAYATVLRSSVVSSLCDVCIVAKRCVLRLTEKKTAGRSEQEKLMAIGKSNGHVIDDVK